MFLQDSQRRSSNISKIDVASAFQLLRGNTKGTSNQYPNATRVAAVQRKLELSSTCFVFKGNRSSYIFLV